MPMRHCFVVVLASVVALVGAQAAEPPLLPQTLADAGWALLFDGETLGGWQPTGDAKWQVTDRTMRTAGQQPGFLMTAGEFADFELHVEFKAPAATNSGVFLRTALEPTDPTKDCYELNIAPPENPFPTGGLVGRKKVVLAAEGFPAADQWHAFDVTADGGKLAVRLDGTPILEYDDPEPIRRGHIGLQSNSGEVAFRNIRIRVLPR